LQEIPSDLTITNLACAAMSSPQAACGPVEAFVRPSCGFGCSKSILQLTTCPFLIILNLIFMIQVFLSATLLRLLPLQL